MIPVTSRNPHSSLPFELFRLFGPKLDSHLPFAASSPPCIHETDNEIVRRMELPEIRKESVQMTLENDVLTIRAERKVAEEVKS